MNTQDKSLKPSQKSKTLSVQDKSLLLAELMGWAIGANINTSQRTVITGIARVGGILRPYDGDGHGLAQFAAILLKFPEVFYHDKLERWDYYHDCANVEHIEPTQANILDEILRMNGVEI